MQALVLTVGPSPSGTDLTHRKAICGVNELKNEAKLLKS
jgi:hypothetical protein